MNRRRVLRFLAAATLSFTAFVCVVSWIIGGKLIAPANGPVGEPPGRFETMSVDSGSGTVISGWYSESPDSVSTMILLHALRADRRSMIPRAVRLLDEGYSVLLIDLQGHGESIGENITLGHLESLDVIAAINWVKKRDPDQRIGVIGRSLGGAAALLASPVDIDALVLECVYPTIEEAVRNRIRIRIGGLHHVVSPLLLLQLKPRLGISASQLRPIDKIANVDCPVLILGGEKDEHTMLSETQSLYDSASKPKELVIFDGAAHTDLLEFDEQLYYEKVLPFLKASLRENSKNSHITK